MHIGPLPIALQDIREDGRTIQEIVAALESNHVAVFQKELFRGDYDPVPPPFISYDFVATTANELPPDARSNARRAFEAAILQHGKLSRPSLRAALLLMERMRRENLYADIFVMSKPVFDQASGKEMFITLGYEDEEGIPWVAAVAANYAFTFDREVLLFLDGSA